MHFCGYSSTQKDYKCYHPPIRQFYVSSDVSFVEHESYFNHPYLGDIIHGRYKYIGDFFLLDLPQSIYKPSQSQSQSSASELVSKHSQIPESTSPNLRNPPSRKQVPSSTRPTLVYSRKKATIVEPMQVQESKPTTSYQVNDPSFPKISPDFIDISDLNLPIAVRKDTRTYAQHP